MCDITVINGHTKHNKYSFLRKSWCVCSELQMSASWCQAEDTLSILPAMCFLYHDGTVMSEEHRGPGQRYTCIVESCIRVSSENWEPYLYHLFEPFINVVFFIWKLPNALWILCGVGCLLWAPSIVLHLKVELPFSFLFSGFLLSWPFPTLSSDQVLNRYRYWRENNKEHNNNM